jgi:zona occludens toxin
MIILITGALGTGKTALAVKLLMESGYYNSSAYVFGVRGWKGKGTFSELKAAEHAPENQALLEKMGRVSHSCYLVDEAKKVWPTRVAGRPEPAFINNHMAESRSITQDWILTAQAPGQIDVALRRLVGRHIHLEAVALGIKKCEAGACRDDLKFFPAECEKFAFPVASLEMYDSDEGVTKTQKKGVSIPKKFVYLGVLLVGLMATAGYFLNKSTMFQTALGTKAEEVTNNGIGAVVDMMPRTKEVKPLPPEQVDSPFYYDPEVSSYPELAKAPRYPVSCVASVRKCSCYDQAGQLIELMGEQRCREIVAGKNKLAVIYPKPERERREPKRETVSRETNNLEPSAKLITP